jgi:hypothetical protein
MAYLIIEYRDGDNLTQLERRVGKPRIRLVDPEHPTRAELAEALAAASRELLAAATPEETQ